MNWELVVVGLIVGACVLFLVRCLALFLSGTSAGVCPACSCQRTVSHSPSRRNQAEEGI